MLGERRGRVILLNGASGSGRSTVGRALQQVLADPWFLFPVDSLGAMRATRHARVLDDDEIEAMLRRTQGLPPCGRRRGFGRQRRDHGLPAR